MDIYMDDGGELTATQIELLNRVVEATAKLVPDTNASEVSISFVSTDEIQSLNRDYRGKDLATDVLSFPVSDEFVIGPGRPLGDIVICMDVAKVQADEYGHSLERELSFLVAHGMLHLLGYDHETPEDEAIMCATQDKVLGLLGISRNEK
ncbi:MAG: rRNA maturation RNase YbeY [Defluviitaleaceae bacterium]|nr:rRNA maturation RNase YbeY [Defluviitaleaceae bacterium]